MCMPSAQQQGVGVLPSPQTSSKSKLPFGVSSRDASTPDMPSAARLDKARREAQSTMGGGTYQGRTVMQGVPRNTDVQALRRTTMLGV